jgi:TPR repeat protein
MAADQGDIEALMNLGVCYEQGQGVAQNASRAVKLFTQVAKQGHPVAQFNLARCYFKGEGIAQDKSKAVKWCRKAAEQGFTEAQFVLGGQLLIRDETVPDNVAEANVAEGVMWLRKAAEQGHAGAQNTLGKCYDHGVCVPEDRSEAAKWLKKAAEQGLAAAQEYLNNDEEYNEMEEALIAGFLKQLADDDDKVCEAAYNSLVRRGSRVLPSLFNSLGDLDWQVAKMSVKAIVEIDSDQLPHLLNHIGELLPDDLEELTLENRQRAGFHYAMRGQLYELIENLDDAVRDYTAATKCDPRLETGNWFLLARAQESNGDERLRQAIEAYGEGQSLANGGQYAKAAEQYQLAMKVCSSFPWGFNDLAWLLATCSETSLRDGRQAVELAKKAVALGHKNDWSLWDTLAAAFAESGQYPEAVKAMQQAQKIAPEGAKREIAFNLRRYQSGLPWSAMESGD